MKLLNPDSSNNPYIRIGGWDDNRYWFLNKPEISDDIVQQIMSSDNAFFIACDEFEVTTTVFDYLINIGVPRNKIVRASENADLDGTYYWSSAPEMGLKIQITKFSKFDTLEKKTYDKKFLSFNRRWRLHRPCIVGLLKAKGLLDHGLVSLGKSDDHMSWDIVFDTIVKILEPDQHLQELFVKNKKMISSIPELYLDTTDLITPKDRIVGNVDIKKLINLYQQTYFSVVTETYFFENPGRFLTEKTFKPIAFKHPFILMAQPNSLELIKRLGYKTFHPYINESYDTELDNMKRLRLILDEIERLSTMSNSQVDEFISNVKEITNFNFRNLMTKKVHNVRIG